MLTDDEKQRIRAEEFYRQEVRAKLTKPSSRLGRIVAFFDTSLGGWLLTSVFVGMMGVGYAHWQGRKIEAEASRKVVQSLDAEIAERLRTFRADLFESDTNFVSAFNRLNRISSDKVAPSIVPEYQTRSFSSLLWELMRALPSSESQQIKNAYECSSDMSRMFSPIEHSQWPVYTRITITVHCRELFEVFMNLQRWGYPFRPTTGDNYFSIKTMLENAILSNPELMNNLRRIQVDVAKKANGEMTVTLSVPNTNQMPKMPDAN